MFVGQPRDPASPSLISLAKRCLARDVAARLTDASAIAAEIAAFIESSMQRAEQDWCRFFQISEDLFCIASLDGYFKRISSNFSRVLGYSQTDLVSKPFVQFIHPDDVRNPNHNGEWRWPSYGSFDTDWWLNGARKGHLQSDLAKRVSPITKAGRDKRRTGRCLRLPLPSLRYLRNAKNLRARFPVSSAGRRHPV